MPDIAAVSHRAGVRSSVRTGVVDTTPDLRRLGASATQGSSERAIWISYNGATSQFALSKVAAEPRRAVNKQTNLPGLRSRLISVLPAVAVLLAFAATCEAQTQIFPQLTDGGGWRMAIFLENTTATTTTASHSFYQGTANGATTPWNPPFVQTSNTQNIPIPAGGTYYLSTPGTAATLSQGWGQLTGTGVVGFVVYTLESYAGRPDQDGTSQATTAASRILVPFDNTTGFATGFAVVNPTGSAETISVNIETDTGAVTQTQLPSIPAAGQLALVAATQFPWTVGHRGMAEFYVSSGSISIAAFRFNPSLALTSLSTFPQTGSPIIGSGGSSSGGGGTLPQFSEVLVTGTSSYNGPFEAVIIKNAEGSVGSVTILPPVQPGVNVGCTFSNVSVNGDAFTLTGPETGSACYMLNGASNYGITSGSVTITLSPQGSPTVGNVSGTFTLTSELETLSGTISGSYTATN